MKVLIIGGAGYIGSHCNKYFQECGIDTTVLDNLSTGHIESIGNTKFIQGDFGDSDFINIVLKEGEYDAIIHFAASADVPDSIKNPNKYYKNNVSNFITLLDAMVKNDLHYIVFSSSASVYGNPVYTPIDEYHPKSPISPYGMSKLFGEQMLLDYYQAYGIKYCSLRYFNACGAYPNASIGESHFPERHLIPLILKSINRTPLTIFGNDYSTKDGTCIRDYIHVLDMADAHYTALNYIVRNNTSACLNLGSNIGYSILEIINICEEVTSYKIMYEYANRREGDPQILLAGNKKAKDILEWDAKKDIYQIVEDAWKWECNRKY